LVVRNRQDYICGTQVPARRETDLIVSTLKTIVYLDIFLYRLLGLRFTLLARRTLSLGLLLLCSLPRLVRFLSHFFLRNADVHSLCRIP